MYLRSYRTLQTHPTKGNTLTKFYLSLSQAGAWCGMVYGTDNIVEFFRKAITHSRILKRINNRNLFAIQLSDMRNMQIYW